MPDFSHFRFSIPIHWDSDIASCKTIQIKLCAMDLPTIEIVEKVTSSYDESMLENHVQRVAQSAQFMRADTLRKLLLYLWDNRNKEISEYAVATEALGRRADFDPKTDASVRVQISRLRSKLKDFYETEELGEAYTLCIPMGTHTLTILENELPLSMPTIAEAARTPFSHTQYVRLPLIITWVALVILSSWLLWNRHTRSSFAQRPFVKATSFWTTFIGPRTPVTIILPTPTFFQYPKLSKFHVRDINVNDYQAWKTSDTLKSLAKINGTPSLDHSYTVTSDTLAAIDLAIYMESDGVADRVVFEVSSDSSMNLLERANVIAFGGYSTLYAFRDYLASMNFSMGPEEAWVANAHPTAGEPVRYAVSDLGSGLRIEPAIIAVLPGRAPNLKLLIMQAKHTNALVLMLTSKIGDSLFQKMYTAHGSPTYFEMVVEYESDGGHIIRTWPVAMHSYTKKAPTNLTVTP
ncbi:MAG: helix-turn-helix domain-containing protein [Acidobacteriaceae bacterium]